MPVQRTSIPGFLAEGLRLPKAKLGKPVTKRKLSAEFDFDDQENSLKPQETKTRRVTKR